MLQDTRAIDARFLKIFLETPLYWKQLQAVSAGTGQPNVNGQALGRLELPLPPLAEQKRIVAKVDELMALCDRLEAQQQARDAQSSALARASLARFAQAPTPANLNLLFHKSYSITPAELRKAILAMAVQGKLVSQDPSDESAMVSLGRIESVKKRLQRSGEIGKDKPVDPLILADLPFDIPSSWAWVKLADLTELITKGSSPKWQGVAYVSEVEGVLFITSENVGNYTLRKLDDLKYVEKRFNEIEPRSILKHGDILMNLVGASIGRTGLYSLHDPANINQAVALIRLVRDAKGICPAFLLHYLNSPSAIDSMLSSRVVTAQPNISLTDARNFAIPFPPLAEQRRIVAKVDQLMALVDQLETQLAASRTTAKNLLKALVVELTNSNQP
jgi:type I restriction enzyme, S subunit